MHVCVSACVSICIGSEIIFAVIAAGEFHMLATFAFDKRQVERGEEGEGMSEREGEAEIEIHPLQLASIAKRENC